MRVYDLSKQLNMSNKELLDRFRSLGIELKSHSSSIEDKMVRILLDDLEKSGHATATIDVSSPPKEEKERPKAAAAKKPAKRVEKAAPAAKAEPEKPVDARALALEAIARAKALRAERQKIREKQEPEGTSATPRVELEHQELDVATRRAAFRPGVSGAKPSAPGQPAPLRAEPTEGQRVGLRPGAEPAGGPAPGPGAGARRSQPFARRDVELQQLPSLHRKRTPAARGEKAADLTVPPSIEVMKLRPTRRSGPGKRKGDEDGGEAGRRKPAPLKGTGKTEKRIRPGRFLNIDTIEESVEGRPGVRGGVKRRVGGGIGRGGMSAPAVAKPPEVVRLRGDMTVGEFAEKIKVSAAEVLTKAMSLGEMLTINKIISTDLCELLAGEFEVHVEIVPEGDEYDVAEFRQEDDLTDLLPRPPVVTIMGHVDHGKTTLLDTIRKTKVAEGEYGGITQHIGAYRVSVPNGEVVFLDTPGHEAFTAMRARGAGVTDIVVLIVAADDGPMPQTVEAINHSKAAEVPMIVAINKIDLPGANVQKVKNDLMQYGLLSEDLGGETIFCEISAKGGQGIDNLIEMILLQAEMLDLKANRDCRASGVVIESEVDPLRGINATVLVERGTLRVGDPFVCGDVSGRVRAMVDEHGHEAELALPSYPIEILGLDGCPKVGDSFIVLESERQARQIAEIREVRRRRQMQNASLRPHVTLEGLSDFLNQDDKPKNLNVILKGDVQGSVEAVEQSMQRLSNEKVNIVVLHKGVGAVAESDVQLAMASDAIIVGFNIRPDATAADLASREQIDIRTYRVIYELLEDLQKAMVGMLDMQYREVARGAAQVRQVFKVSRTGIVAGCYVTSGNISRNDKIRLVRDGVVVYEGAIGSLRRVKDDVSSVQSGYECGITLSNFQDIKEGDVIEAYQLEEVAPVM
ncbi:translation initiation factor IF-2 [Candidatus Sumerlaeota bacterium]|nr:translation initiation factor IF-2 [Candidatus Sumerlaeota bacterium]